MTRISVYSHESLDGKTACKGSMPNQDWADCDWRTR